MSAGRYADVAKLGRKVVHVPFAVGGIGVFHSVPEGMLGGKPLHLTGCVLAKIFSAQITKWDDPEIVALNPDSTATAAIKVVHRKKGSSSTSGFTEYMARKCPAEWTEKGWQAKSTIVWPAGTAEAQGSGGMSAYIQENEYAIGYIDAGHGHDKGLSEIALMNKDGNYLTTKQADIGAAATVALAPGSNLIPTDPSADFSGVNLYDMSGPDTWPITMISYFYLDPDMTAMDPDTAAILLFFVNFVIGAEGQAIASNKYNMFVPLPKALQDYNAKTLADHVTPPAGMVPFQEELASNTLILTGAGDHYISGKRRSYAELERERTVKALEALQAEEAAHEADESHENGHANGAVNATTTIALPWVGEQEITTIAQAGLGLGVVGFVFGFIALIVAIGACMTKTQKPRSQEIPVRNLDVPKSAV
jgi:ABC-type phosphate transport system substrate-binding protein